MADADGHGPYLAAMMTAPFVLALLSTAVMPPITVRDFDIVNAPFAPVVCTGVDGIDDSEIINVAGALVNQVYFPRHSDCRLKNPIKLMEGSFILGDAIDGAKAENPK